MAEVPSTWAVASDLSDVIETDDGFGAFATANEANDRLIEMLEAARAENSLKLAAAKRRRRKLVRNGVPA